MQSIVLYTNVKTSNLYTSAEANFSSNCYADLIILCGVTRSLSHTGKLLKILHQKLTAFYFQIYAKNKKKVVTKNLLLFFCQIKIKPQPFPQKIRGFLVKFS